ncbi:MAG: PASTA domain-containing protein, partial [Thermaerobacterales bacterium]
TLGLAVDKVFVFNDEVPEGHIIEHLPRPESPVQVLSTVTLVVSQGREGGPFSLPEFRGRSLEDVRAQLAELNLRVGEMDTQISDYPPQTVHGQFPAPGAMVRPGDNINLSVSRGNGVESTETTVTIHLPEHPEAQEVMIKISDHRSERIVQSSRRSGGESFDVTVFWYGDRAWLTVESNGRLVAREEIE